MTLPRGMLRKWHTLNVQCAWSGSLASVLVTPLRAEKPTREALGEVFRTIMPKFLLLGFEHPRLSVRPWQRLTVRPCMTRNRQSSRVPNEDATRGVDRSWKNVLRIMLLVCDW